METFPSALARRNNLFSAAPCPGYMGGSEETQGTYQHLDP